jgi:SAM-dependent methyltransferase
VTTTAGESLPAALYDSERAMPGLARWMYRTARGYLGKSVLDAGAGIGAFVDLMLRDGKTVTAMEFLPELVEELRRRFGGDERVSVRAGDLSDAAAFEGLSGFDSVLCLNVLEHIEDDAAAMRNLLDITRPGGTMVALVPAYHWLFNRMDRSVGHHRRYGRGEFVERLTAAGWTVERCFRFNAVAVAGWFFAGSILRRDKPGQDLARIYDALIPAFAFVENHVWRRAVGLSVIAVCRRAARS